MRITYIGKFSKFHNTENYVMWALQQQQDVHVIKRDYTRLDELSAAKATIIKDKPDVVLFSKASPKCTRELLAWCRSKNILTVSWIWDLYWGYRKARPAQFLADLLFTTDGGHEEAFAKHGCKHAVLRQGIHLPDHVIYPCEPSHDVAFVGGRGGHPSRMRLVKWLAREYGLRFIHHTNVRGLALNKALARVKIVVGDSYPASDYWSNRIYEILGRGGFLLHPATAGLDDEFSQGLHYIAYARGDMIALRERISHCLSNDAGREQIRQQGFKHCGDNYTYTHRAYTLLTHIRQALADRQRTST